MAGQSELYCESADFIVEGARSRGIRISKEQLGGWHREGLIPHTRTDYPGGGGSCSFYPRGTFEQALACAKLLKARRSVQDAGWCLWIAGFPIREDVWRAHFVGVHRTILRFCTRHLQADEATDRLSSQLAKASKARRLPDMLGGMRRRLGASGLRLFSELIVSILVGGYRRSQNPKDDESDLNVIGRMAWIQSAKKKKTIVDNPILSDTAEELAQRLSVMSSAISKIRDPNFLANRPSDEFCTARDEWNFLVKSYVGIRESETAILGRPHPHATFALRLLRNPSPKRHATLILGWLACREIPQWKLGFANFREMMIDAGHISSGNSASGDSQSPID